jgi:hypothetical protein
LNWIKPHGNITTDEYDRRPPRKEGLFLRLIRFAPLLLLVALFPGGCNRHESRTITPAFYYWRTEFSLSDGEKSRMATLGVDRLYMRFFDVDWDAATDTPYPTQTIHGRRDTSMNAEVVPTIFLTNRTFQQIRPADIPGLATKVATLTFSLGTSMGFPPPRELQIDCDWTETTRPAFFEFIRELRLITRRKGVMLSSTIRLHQVKFREMTGVPPVDRGVLMFYNMGNLQDPATFNSILDLEVARKYLDRLDDYPLPLDVALPTYSWGVVYRRGRVVDLINNLSNNDFADHAKFAIEQNRVAVLKSSFFDYRHLYAGDVIRIEAVSLNKLHDAASLLSKHLRADSLRIIYFHLDTQSLRGYTNEDLQAVCAAFR